MSNQHVRVERVIAGKRLCLETGQVARQAGGAVIATLGDSKVFAACTAGAPREDIDFFPLVCDYREKTEAAGKIPGGFFKREGRPTTKEILTMRLVDRSIRPMFPDGYKAEVQVMSHALGYDGVVNTDVLAMIASFAAVRISGLPFETTLGAVRIGHLDGELCVWPQDDRRRTESRLDLVVSGHKEGICMVESSAIELAESEMIEALELAHETILQIVDLIDELVAKSGRTQQAFEAPQINEQLCAKVFQYESELAKAIRTEGKHERSAAMVGVKKRCVEALSAGCPEGEQKALSKEIGGFWGKLCKQVERRCILSGRRVDGRAWDEVREITIVPNFVPRQHGSVLFTRGETQALVSTTLGTPDDETIIDGIEKEYRKNFYLHYNFPAYSVGETKRIMGPGRREIGHGMLAERSLMSIVPDKDTFPYTIRIVSDIMESNGSSSMASVCGGCLAMMLAGVPLRQPVAGIAMGLVQEGDQIAVLSDILGSEDHTGDMDFKVAGSGLGITALQMDIKITGVNRQLLEKALRQARDGRIHILRKMLEAVPAPSGEVSEYAPRMETIQIPAEKIGFLIGPGGRNIKEMQAKFDVRIAIVDNDGKVQVSGVDAAAVKKCIETIQASCETPKIGSRYTGEVRSVRDFGAFIEILPGTEALCHISELADGYVGQVTDVVDVGDKIEVIVINVDDRGKVKVSHKAALSGVSHSPEDGGDDAPRRDSNSRDGERGDGGERGDRGDRGDRGGYGGPRDGGDDRPRRSRSRGRAGSRR